MIFSKVTQTSHHHHPHFFLIFNFFFFYHFKISFLFVTIWPQGVWNLELPNQGLNLHPL